MPCKLAISSLSLGRAWHHALPTKLAAASHHGYLGVELFHEDLDYHARSLSNTPRPSPAQYLSAASDIRRLCLDLDLSIVSLGPFSHCEGLRDPGQREAMFERLEAWMGLAAELGTDVIQIPSSFLPVGECTGEFEVLVRDLREVAMRGAERNIRFAYESLSWGTHTSTWEASWALVTAISLPNFGLCLDTFNIAGRVYADPSSPSGTTPNALSDLEASTRRLLSTVDVSKIFYVEVVSASRLSSPLVKGHEFYDESQSARMSWSRNCRLFYGEEGLGAYLPIVGVVKALLEKEGGLGFEGWVSFELFNRSLAQPGSEVPTSHASRGLEAWRRMQEDVDFAASPDLRHRTKSNGTVRGGAAKQVDGHVEDEKSRARVTVQSTAGATEA